MAVKKNTEVENVEVTETVEKEAVNVLDLLLGSDLGTIKQPHKDMEITRLSEALGCCLLWYVVKLLARIHMRKYRRTLSRSMVKT